MVLFFQRLSKSTKAKVLNNYDRWEGYTDISLLVLGKKSISSSCPLKVAVTQAVLQ